MQWIKINTSTEADFQILCPVSSIHHLGNGFLSYPQNLFRSGRVKEHKKVFNCTAVDKYYSPTDTISKYHSCLDSSALLCPLHRENVILTRKFSSTYPLRPQTCSFTEALHNHRHQNLTTNFYFFGGSVTDGLANSYGCCCIFDAKCPNQSDHAFECQDGEKYFPREPRWASILY